VIKIDKCLGLLEHKHAKTTVGIFTFTIAPLSHE